MKVIIESNPSMMTHFRCEMCSEHTDFNGRVAHVIDKGGFLVDLYFICGDCTKDVKIKDKILGKYLTDHI